MLLFWLLLSSHQLWLRDCGHLVDAEELRKEIKRVRADRGELTFTCVGDRVFLNFGDEAIPKSEVVGVVDLKPEQRAAYLVRALFEPNLRAPPSAEDLSALVLTPRMGDVPIVVRSSDESKRVPLSLIDDSELCRTPCILHTRPGKLDWVRGGGEIRRVPESFTVPPQGADVFVRAPSFSAFATGAVITGLGALMDVVGIVMFFASIGSYSTTLTVTGFAMWLSADLAVLPTGIVMMILSRLGKPDVVGH